ncbi:hypothetical protein AA313_de0206349 [Arthrobotrys entomopaga]|nr:hypothetical protein AA313_de0206349 [Arthrobotrys entomopaga]
MLTSSSKLSLHVLKCFTIPIEPLKSSYRSYLVGNLRGRNLLSLHILKVLLDSSLNLIELGVEISRNSVSEEIGHVGQSHKRSLLDEQIFAGSDVSKSLESGIGFGLQLREGIICHTGLMLRETDELVLLSGLRTCARIAGGTWTARASSRARDGSVTGTAAAWWTGDRGW